MKFWLVKSEPSTYSWQQMQYDNITCWDGVRNYQARNNMKEMKLYDIVFFYHSNKEKAILGIIKVIREYYPDYTDKSERFGMVDFQYVKGLTNPVTLKTIKSHTSLQNILLIKQSRLSVMPISKAHYNIIINLSLSKT